MTNQDVLKEANQVMEAAKARLIKEQDREYIIKQVSETLKRDLALIFSEMNKTTKEAVSQYIQEIKNIKIEVPQVTVQPPEVKVPKIESPEVKVPEAKVDVKIPEIKIPEIKLPKIEMPKVRVPAPQVTVKAPEVRIPPIKVPTPKVTVKPIINLDKPLNVILTDPKGKEYKALSSMVTGGGGGVVTTRRIDDIPVGFEQLAVTDTATGLASIPATANKAVMTVEDASMRYRVDGTDPTSTVGLRVLPVGTIILNSRQALTNFKAIRIGATNSELNINYYESK